MICCPTCTSRRVVIVLSDERKAFCGVCGTTWVQDGTDQRRISGRGRARSARPDPA